jgi:hypothetical protein
VQHCEGGFLPLKFDMEFGILKVIVEEIWITVVKVE